MSRQARWLLIVCNLVWATDLSAASVGFQPPANYPVGSAPVSIAGDFNGDGTTDLAVANEGDGTMSILLGNGDGTFKAAVNFTACKNCNYAFYVAAADFNADSNSDLAMLRSGNVNANDDGNVTIFLSNGDGTFHKGQVLTPGENPSSVISADVNADHRLDLVVTNRTDSTVAILFGKGDATFQAPFHYTTRPGPRLVSLVDIDQDGLKDLAVSRSSGADILWANGDGTFRPGPSVTTNLISPILAWADFNQDGKIDYLVLECIPLVNCSLRVALGNGDGTFQGSGSVSSSALGSIADFDGDGKLDIAGSDDRIPGQISVLLGNGDATFQSPVYLTVKSGVLSDPVLAADLNGDKAPDLVTLNSDNTISVLLNSGTDFSISASKLTPATVSRGQSSTSTVTVSLVNEFDNPVALTCSVQPAGSGAPSCSMSPNSVTPPPNGNATATLTITAASTAALIHGSSPFLWMTLPLVGLVAAGAASRSGPKRKLACRRLRGVLFAGLLVQIACGGDRNGKSSAQSYTVTITGSSTFTQHSTTVSLGVQ